MPIRVLVLACLLSAASGVHARAVAQGDPASLAARADDHARSITDAASFLEEIDVSVRMARSGEYGRLQRGDLRRLDVARDRIAELLEGHGTALELPPEERLALFNAQESITATLRNDDKNRKICMRAVSTGSRIPTTECLTVAERESRARVARENADRMRRNMCFVSTGPEGEAHDCVK